MKSITRAARASAAALALGCIAERSILAGGTELFTIEAFAISNGGGVSTNSEFHVTGAIGQPATASSASEQFQLDPGFFRTLELDLPTGPVTLTFASQAGNLKISWPASGTEGFILEHVSNLAGNPDWQPAPESPDLQGSMKSVLAPIANGNQFYRLRLR
jgi:hypothetical protein